MTVEVKKPVKRPTGAPAPAAAAPAPTPAPAPEALRRRRRPAARSSWAVAALPRRAAPARLRRRRRRALDADARVRRGQAGRGGIVLRTLTEEEKEARARALVDANRDAEVARQRAAEDAKRRDAEEKVRAEGRGGARKRLAEEEARKKTEDEIKRKADALVQKRIDQAGAAPQTPMARQVEEIGAAAADAADCRARARPTVRAPPAGFAAAGRRPRPARCAVRRCGRPWHRPSAGRRRRVRAARDPSAAPTRSTSVARSRARTISAAGRWRSSAAAWSASAAARTPTSRSRRSIARSPFPRPSRSRSSPSRMSERGADVIKTLMGMGVMATINQAIDPDTAELVVTEMGHRFKRVTEGDVETGLTDAADADDKRWSPRPPVVTIMGHVDHGKTSLLDALRATDVAAHEAGGITQHIGAYQVTLPSGQKITFLDTPGHEAFTAMRARGAKVTDIVVLVVAATTASCRRPRRRSPTPRRRACRSSSPSTRWTRRAPMPSRVQNELLRDEIQVEELGGEVQSIEVSATKKTNLDKLEEAILLQAEVLELKANPDRAADGVVIEAKLDPGRGSVATVLVQRGTLKVGDVLVAGAVWGRVRRLVDDRGQAVETAGPAFPVEILGLDGTPQAGDEFHVVESEARAREIADFRVRRDRQAELARAAGGRGTLEEMMKGIREGTAKELPVLIKADVQGSAEALAGAISRLSTEKVATRVVLSGVGGISEADMTLAKASGALIIGFNVRANPQAREIAKRDKIDIRYYCDHLQGHRGHRGADARPASTRPTRRPSSATRRSARSSASPRPATSPAAWSRKAWSSAAPRSACCATTW